MTVARVLVTGAGGFIGRHVLPELRRAGYEVHAIGRRPLEDAADIVHHRLDLMDSRAVDTLVQAVKPSHLLHLAWTVTPGQFWRAPENLDWVAASLHLYRSFVRVGGRRVLAVGTCAEYDWSYETLDEVSTPCRPATLYGVAKDSLHRLLAAAARQDGVELAWGRLFFLYGPHEPAARLVPDVTLSLLHDKPALCGDGAARRDFMHVEDVARALALVLTSDYCGPVNVASGDCLPLRDIITDLGEILGKPDLIRLGARPPVLDEPITLAGSISILHQRLGFRPAYTRRQGLQDTVTWWKAQTAQ